MFLTDLIKSGCERSFTIFSYFLEALPGSKQHRLNMWRIFEL